MNHTDWLIISRIKFNKIIFILYIIQYLNDKNAAAPALIHYSSESLDGSSRKVTKLVECPVVLKVPALENE